MPGSYTHDISKVMNPLNARILCNSSSKNHYLFMMILYETETDDYNCSVSPFRNTRMTIQIFQKIGISICIWIVSVLLRSKVSKLVKIGLGWRFGWIFQMECGSFQNKTITMKKYMTIFYTWPQLMHITNTDTITVLL